MVISLIVMSLWWSHRSVIDCLRLFQNRFVNLAKLFRGVVLRRGCGNYCDVDHWDFCRIFSDIFAMM